MKYNRLPKWLIFALVGLAVYFGMKKGIIPNPFRKS